MNFSRARSVFTAMVLVVVTASLVVAGPASVAQAGEPESLYSLVNRDRAESGKAPLARNASLDLVAVNWAGQMAANREMAHNPDFYRQIPPNWMLAGENVAYGQQSGAAVHAAWMASAGHRANILGDFTDIGVAFIVANGSTWSVEVFAKYPRAAVTGVTPFVTALYADVLRRAAGPSEIDFWTRQLNSGVTTTTAASGFVTSDEYRLMRITSAYGSILARSGENSGVYNWLGLMKQGVLQTDDVDKYFMASDEYLLRSGGTNESFVRSMYQQLLARPVAESEIPFWTRIAGQSGRLAVVNGIWQSTESARSRVTLMYQAYLGRTPDEAGVASWATLALQGGDAAVRWQIIGSAEYWGRAQSRFPS